MDIQWSLVLFTALTGMGGWLFFFICLNVFVRKTDKARSPHGDGLGADRRRRPGLRSRTCPIPTACWARCSILLRASSPKPCWWVCWP